MREGGRSAIGVGSFTVSRATHHSCVRVEDSRKRGVEEDIEAEVHSANMSQHLEDVRRVTPLVLSVMQTRGALSLSQIASRVRASASCVQDVLDVLVTTPLVDKAYLGDCDKKTNDSIVYMYRGGTPMSSAVSLKDLTHMKAREQREVTRCAQRIKVLKEELSRPSEEVVDSKTRARHIFRGLLASNPRLREDPLYRHVARVVRVPTTPSADSSLTDTQTLFMPGSPRNSQKPV